MKLVPILVLGAALVPPAAAQTGGGVACYQVKDRATPRSATVNVTSAGVVQSCRAHSPARLACVGADGASAGGAFLCYRLHCPRTFRSPTSMTADLGGQRVVTFKGAQLLCEPAQVQPGGSSTTSTTVAPMTTTTVASGSCEFDDSSRTCTGTCGGGGHCSAVVSGGACECRTTACGDASSPSCNGYCARDQACIFDITGCSCVSIP